MPSSDILAVLATGTLADRADSQGTFNALVLHENSSGKVETSVERRGLGELPEGDVLVRIQYSCLNYKDGMILSGIGRLVRNYPHIPGIDFAGVVERSDSPDWREGDKVVLTGWRVGEQQWGGHAEFARVKAGWLTALPPGLTPLQSMAVGTAGLTAMLATMALEEHKVRPDLGEVAVTGATGGVGSVAVAILAQLGFRVVASTGRPEMHDYLKSLGAAEVMNREALAQTSDRPLESERWAGAIDTVGGSTLPRLLSQMRRFGSVAACGLVAGSDLHSTLIPFLLRGVNLLGIDSVFCPAERRAAAWSRLPQVLPLDRLGAMTEVIGLQDLPAYGKRILKGDIKGRVVVEISR